MRYLILAPMLLLGASAVQASDSASWNQFNRAVARTCTAASGLQSARTSSIVGFDDSLGKVATLVTGQQRIRVRGGWKLTTVKQLCIYDKRTKHAWVDEAAGWSAPNG